MNTFLKNLKEILNDKVKRRKIKKVFGFLAVLVLIVTAFAIKIPAMTLEKDQAEEKSIPIEDEDFTYKNKEEAGVVGQEDTYQDFTNGEEEQNPEVVKEEKQGIEENPETETKNTNTKFSFQDGPIKAEVSLKERELPEESKLVIDDLSANKPRMSFFRMASPQSETSTNKDKQIEELIDGQVLEIKYLDISFYDANGEYLPVEDNAQVSLDISNLDMELGDNEEISIGHFGQTGLEFIDPEVEIDPNNQVQEVTFDTQGFSVFAIVKHANWKRFQVKGGPYTIALEANDDNLYSIDLDQNNVIKSRKMAEDDLVEIYGKNESEIPYNFSSMNTAMKYRRFTLIPNGNDYFLQEVDSYDYLAIDNGDVIISEKPYKFKLYENSNYPGRIKIMGQDDSGSPQFLAYDNGFKVVNTYKEAEEITSSFFLIRNKRYYQTLSNSQLKNIPDEGQFVILTDNSQITKYQPKGFMSNYIDPNRYSPVTNSQGKKYRDSTTMLKNGEIYTSDLDYLRDYQYREPSMLTFKKIRSNPDVFYITDENGDYLKLTGGSWAEIQVVAKNEVTPDNISDFEITMSLINNTNEVYLHKGNSYINMDTTREIGGWHIWGTTSANSRVKLGVLLGDSYQGDYHTKDKLIDAVIPDGYYAITNKDANRLMYRTNAQDFQRSAVSNDRNGRLYRGTNLGNLNNGLDIFRIRNKKDGTYEITQTGVAGGSRGYLRITSKGTDSDYKSLAFYETSQQRDDYKIKISTIEDDPSLFYLHNDYGSIDIFPNNSYNWRSRQGDLGDPLRLYRVEMDANGNNISNKRFIHQEKAPTEDLVDLENGDYILGYSKGIDQEDNDFNSLSNDNGYPSVKKAWIKYYENIDSDVPVIVSQDSKVDLDQWSIRQTENPGYYEIKLKSDSEVRYLSLTNGVLLLSKDKETVRLYSKKDGNNNRVLITDGTSRVRYHEDKDGGHFIAVSTDEPIADEDYIYLGKKFSDSLGFEITTPSEYVGAKWDENVKLDSKVSISDMVDEDGKLTFAKVIPGGYAQDNGPIGNLYKTQKDTDIDNPYKNLYRLYLDVESFPMGEDSPLKNNYYVEYGLLGYRLELNSRTYLVDKNAEFTIDKDEFANKKVVIDKSYVKEINETGEKIPASSNLEISFDDNPIFKTEWIELSTPLYFYYDTLEGIMDIERGINAKELLDREKDTNVLSPILAEGRVLFTDKNEFTDPSTSSSITMDDNIGNKVRYVNNISFPDNITEDIDNTYKNQIVFNSLASGLAYQNILGDYSQNNVVTSMMLKRQSIEWLKSSPNNYEAGLLKYDINNHEESTIFKLDKSNMDTLKMDIDFLTLGQERYGISLQGILYHITNPITIEKDFKNISDDEFSLLQNGDTTSKKFQVDVHFDQDYDGDNKLDVLYNLSFDRGDTEGTLKPSIGDEPLSYWDIERVRTLIDKDNFDVTWTFASLSGLDYKAEESGADIVDEERNLYTNIEEISSINQTDNKHSKYYRKSIIPEGEQISTEVLNTSIHDKVRFTNHYSTGGGLVIKARDIDSKLPLKEKKFRLIKIVNNQEEILKEETTGINGNLMFTELNEGNYKLVEVDPDPIYKDLGDINFSLKKVEEEKGSEDYYYKLEGSPQSNNISFTPYKYENKP